ncbi:MAG: deoxyguanosinetriphosphate triphosphohydrolase, partial [Pseudomonadota bacterium]
GFDHNAQAIRIVTKLERHYAAFDGLNLTWETLEAIAKHNGPVRGDLPWALAECNDAVDLELHTHASAEAQVAALSDDIAYNNHDLMDGLRAGLFADAEIETLPIVGDCYRHVDTRYPGIDPYRRRHEALRRVFGVMVSDVIETSQALLHGSGADRVEDIRGLGYPVIRFSDPLWSQLIEIKNFLFSRMYRAEQVMAKRAEVSKVVKQLFPIYLADPYQMPERWHQDIERVSSETGLARIVSDYIAGMTDRFALQDHARLTGPD